MDCYLYAFGPFELNIAQRRLLRSGEPVAITPKAFDVLLLLVQNQGRLVEKKTLMRSVWPDAFVEEGNVCVTISLLRKALGAGTKYIETVSKHGYRFVAEVRVVRLNNRAIEAHGAASIDVAPATLSPAVLCNESKIGGIRPKVLPIKGRVRIAICTLVLVLAFLGASLWLRTAIVAHAIKTSEVRSIAVLPFQTLGPGLDDKYVGLGMADALITRLGSTGKVVMRPTRTMQKYTNTVQDPRSVGQEQGVDAVLDGRIQLVNQRIRVTAQLIRVVDGVQLWTDTFDQKFVDMFAAEDAVANYVASCIPLELTGEERRRLEKKRTTNSEAYEAYLRGRYFWNERTGEGLKKGLDYFRRAIELDPSYAEAHVGIADSYAMLGLYTVLPPNEAFPQAKLAASKALQMDNSLAEAHATLGFVHFYYDWDGKAAEVEFQRALQEDPNYAMAHSWYAFDLAVMKRFSEAIAEATLAVRGDPLSPIIITNAAWVHFLVGQYSQAIDLSKQAIEIDPNFPRAHYRLGNVYEQLGLKSLAIAEYRKAVSLSGGDTYYEASLGHAYGLAGQESDAVKVLRELRAVSKNRYVAPYAMALVYMGMRDNHRALDWLQRASGDHSTSMAYLTVDPSLSTLRSNPDFETLLRRTNF